METIGNIWALLIRIGFWGPLYLIIVRNPQDSIGSYLTLFTAFYYPSDLSS